MNEKEINLELKILEDHIITNLQRILDNIGKNIFEKIPSLVDIELRNLNTEPDDEGGEIVKYRFTFIIDEKMKKFLSKESIKQLIKTEDYYYNEYVITNNGYTVTINHTDDDDDDRNTELPLTKKEEKILFDYLYIVQKNVEHFYSLTGVGGSLKISKDKIIFGES